MRHRTTAFTLGAASLLTGIACVAALAPAQAAPLEREHYQDTFTDEFDCDGITLRQEVSVQGLFMLKQGRAGDPTPYLSDNYEYSMRATAVPDTGRWFTREGNGLYKDRKITLVQGTVYQFDAIEAGQPFIVRDMDGNLVLRDRGLLHTRFQVDTKGDADQSNDEFVEGSWELVADRGSHPGFYVDYCQMAKDLLIP
jgi:hypothetical protein